MTGWAGELIGRTAEPVARTAGRMAHFGAGPCDDLVMHFGAHKTGSSSIQATLRAHAGPGSGYVYPDLGQANGSLTLAFAFASAQSLRTWDFVHSPTLAAAQRLRMQARLGWAMRAARPGLPTILSGEVIAHFRPPDLAVLDQFARGAARQSRYLGYVREPVSALTSAFQEMIKEVLPTRHFLLPDMPEGFFLRDTHEVIGALDRIAGQTRVEVHAFDRSQFPGGDVVRHFLDRTGIRPDGLPLATVNPGLGLLAVRLLYIYRSRLAPRDGAIGSPWSLDPFIAALATLGGPRFVLHPDLAGRIAKANHPAYDWSARRLPQPFAPPALSAGPEAQTVRGAADLLRLDGQDGDAVADWAALHGVKADRGLSADLDAVAALIHAVRLEFARRHPPEGWRRLFGRDRCSAPREATGLPP